MDDYAICELLGIEVVCIHILHLTILASMFTTSYLHGPE